MTFDGWLMETAYWRDGATWVDAAQWHDYPYLYDIWLDNLDSTGLWTDRPEPEGVILGPPVP